MAQRLCSGYSGSLLYSKAILILSVGVNVCINVKVFVGLSALFLRQTGKLSVPILAGISPKVTATLSARQAVRKKLDESMDGCVVVILTQTVHK